MKKLLLVPLLFFVLTFGVTSTAQAQHLVLNLLSGQTEQYPISEIRSIKFPTNSMVLYQNDGTTISWDIADFDTCPFYQPRINPANALTGVIPGSEAFSVRCVKN